MEQLDHPYATLSIDFLWPLLCAFVLAMDLNSCLMIQCWQESDQIVCSPWIPFADKQEELNVCIQSDLIKATAKKKKKTLILVTTESL